MIQHYAPPSDPLTRTLTTPGLLPTATSRSPIVQLTHVSENTTVRAITRVPLLNPNVHGICSTQQ